MFRTKFDNAIIECYHPNRSYEGRNVWNDLEEGSVAFVIGSFISGFLRSLTFP